MFTHQETGGGEMAEIVITGAGLNGLSLGMLLARDGHQVTVVERDAAPPPSETDALWNEWERRGVNQFRMLHFMLPRWRKLMETNLPEVLDELGSRGGHSMNIVSALPTEISGGWRAGDEVFDVVTARRPVLEAAVGATAAETKGLEIRRGVAIAGLVTTSRRPDDPPQVAGVITEAGETLRADVVIDCCGRRSPLPAWLAAIGTHPPAEEREESGFIYYGRHFRSADGTMPGALCGLLSHYASQSVLTLPADNGTWGVGFVTSARDRELRTLRDVETWERVLARYPLVAHWADGEPISDGVAVMAGIEDRYRSLIIDDRPVVTGVLTVGDSWACTNPSLGRGASIGLLHAIVLRDVLGEVGVDDAEKLTRRFDERTRAEVEPLYRATLAFDRHRLAEIDADRRGEPYEPDDPTWGFSKAMSNGAPFDADVLRGFLSVASLLESPEDVLARPGLFERLVELSPALPQYATPGPDRAELLGVMAG
jgi:2-polyprenyl-6-methoxyphenol hydroxylase-like FAD-dependent oxidoreductase